MVTALNVVFQHLLNQTKKKIYLKWIIEEKSFLARKLNKYVFTLHPPLT